MKAENIEDVYELSPIQRGILLHSVYAPHSGIYVAQRCYKIQGNLNVEALTQAWQAAVNRHQALRTSFHWEIGDKPLQVVHRQMKLVLEQQDWRKAAAAAQQELLVTYLKNDRQRGFSLNMIPLMRLSLMRLAEEEYLLIWSHHMIQLDGWSLAVLIKEVLTFYEMFCQNQDIQMPPVSPYRDYIRSLQQQDMSKAERFWRQELKGFDAPTTVGLNNSATKFLDETQTYDKQRIVLSGNTIAALQTVTHHSQLTMNTIIQGAWSLLLSRYTGENDILYGVVSSGRPADLIGVESMVGLFISALPVRVHITPDTPLLTWLKALQARLIELRQYEYVPLGQIQRWSEIPQPQPLFESIVVVENYPTMKAHDLNKTLGISIELASDAEQTNYPLTVLAWWKQELTIELNYSCEYFDKPMMTRMSRHLKTLLENIAAAPEQRLADVQMLSTEEKHQLLVEWNATETMYPAKETLHRLFEDQVERTPDNVAVVFEKEQFTYRELNQRANQLAHYLRRLRLAPEARVGIFMERSLELVIGLLGILKAGAAYLPLDPTYPKERLAFMEEDAQTPVLLSQKHLESALPENHKTQIIWIDTAQTGVIAQESQENPDNFCAPENVAYVIYTSGSTGKPKGVENTHRGICNRLLWMQDVYQLTEADRVLQKTPFSFDVSVWEFFWPLITGACLVVARPGGHQDNTYLVHLIAERGITTLHFVPSMLQLFLREANIEACHSLRRVICSGEALRYDLQERFFERLDGAALHNLYGPTEAAVDVSFWECWPERARRMIPIGRPIANTQLYVLDPQLRPAPIGVTGELHIGGVGLARGYFNRPALTAEKFIPNPFSDKPGERLYKTGDVCRYRPDGNIEFLNRLDSQVKVRGFRIELEEISAVLSQHPAISQNVVIVREDEPDNKQLVAYLVPDGRPLPSVTELRAFLKERLPEYMVPAAFVNLETLPLTPSGKVNRRALPAPDGTRPDLQARFVAPRTPIERQLAEVWKRVLRIDQVGVFDNFFELGGDSFTVIKVAHEFKGALKVVDLLKYPTIQALAEFMTNVNSDNRPDEGILHKLTRAAEHERFSLVCIPYGGGSAVTYHPLARALPGDFALYALEPPGHDFARHDEPLKSIEDIVHECVEEIAQKITAPLILYGHCIGVALTIEIARVLEERQQAISAVFLGASFPFPKRRAFGFTIPEISLWNRVVPDKKILAYLQSLGGFEESLAPAELKFIMRSFRHDAKCASAYFTRIYKQKHFKKLKAPIISVVGDADPETEGYQQQYKEWEFFSNVVNLAVIPNGGHYFLKHQVSELAQIIRDVVHDTCAVIADEA